MACPLGGERGFSTIFHSCGFRIRCGERRLAMLSQFESLMIFAFLKYQSVPCLFFLIQKEASGE
jgi:hypothetical protein